MVNFFQIYSSLVYSCSASVAAMPSLVDLPWHSEPQEAVENMCANGEKPTIRTYPRPSDMLTLRLLNFRHVSVIYSEFKVCELNNLRILSYFVLTSLNAQTDFQKILGGRQLKSCLAAGLVGFGQGRAPAQETHHGSSFLRCTRNILLVRWVNRGESWWIVVNHFISKISALLFDILTHILILYAFVKTLSLNSWDIGDIGHHDDTPRYCTVRYPTSSNSLNTRLPHVVPASGLASCPIRWLACHAEIQRKRVAALRCMDLYSHDGRKTCKRCSLTQYDIFI